jgi:hypothetical protein
MTRIAKSLKGFHSALSFLAPEIGQQQLSNHTKIKMTSSDFVMLIQNIMNLVEQVMANWCQRKAKRWPISAIGKERIQK